MLTFQLKSHPVFISFQLCLAHFDSFHGVERRFGQDMQWVRSSGASILMLKELTSS